MTKWNPPHQWLITEEKFLREHYRNKGPAFCAKKLGLTKNRVITKAYKLGLSTVHPVRINKRFWKPRPIISIEEQCRKRKEERKEMQICAKIAARLLP